jgi:hypothetical protein
MVVSLELIIAGSIWLEVSVVMKIHVVCLLDCDRLLSITWDTTVSERVITSIFMVDGVHVFLQNDGIYLPDYVVSYPESTHQSVKFLLTFLLKRFQNV